MVVSRRRAIATIGVYLLTKRYVNGKRKNRSCWRRPWIARHDEQGAYYNLIRELEVDNDLCNYLRITKVQFDDIVARVTPVIQWVNTNFRAAISPGERVAVTLRFSAASSNCGTSNCGIAIRQR